MKLDLRIGPLLLLLSLGACSAASSPDSAAPSVAASAPVALGDAPPPTEHWLDEGAEAEQKSRRKAWHAERHAAPPGVDWKAIELANGRAQITKRNALALADAPRTASPWVERGSDNLAGRMHVAVFSTDGGTLYAGSSNGGVWKGSPDGTGWTPIGDNLYGGAHWLAVVSGASPGGPDAVLAATDGGQVHVSHDDGASWLEPLALTGLAEVRRVLVTSDGSETVFVLARRGTRNRLFRSSDGMQTFAQVAAFGNSFGDLWTPRTGSADLYALGNGTLEKSIDLGDTWTTVSLLPGGASSGELTGSEAGAPRLWAVLDVGGRQELHRSDDAGATWSHVRDVGDYWGSLNASILDPGLFAYGGVEAWRTDDGGATFARVNTWGAYYGNPSKRLHADIPGIDVWPTGAGGETWYVSTDGGLYDSSDGLASVNNLSLFGLRVSQYYSTLTGATNGDRVLAGSQDQGYQRADQSAAPTGTTLSFEQLISGDYGHLTSGDGNHGYVFSTYPGFVLAQIGAASPSLHQVSFPPGASNAWLPPVVASNVDKRDFYFCADRLWQYQWNGGASWTPVQWSARDFAVTSGEYSTALAFSPVTPERAYAATNRGRLYTSDDYGVTWTQAGSLGPTAHYFYGTALSASSLDPDTVWVGGSGYGSPAVYRSTDGGLTYQAWGEGLPATLVYCLGEARDGSGVVFCGTETAAYRRGPTDPAWVDVTGNEAPVTIYWSVEALRNENTMRFGTYGRGIWDYQIDVLARTVEQNGSGANAVCFSSRQPPVVGGTFELAVDASAHPGATLSGFVIYDAPASGTYLPGGEVLVDLEGARLWSQVAVSSGGVDDFVMHVPDDPSLVGLLSWAQAVIFGGAGYRLCNALEVVIGY